MPRLLFSLPLVVTLAEVSPQHAREIYATQQHPKAADTGARTREAPLKTISAAAKLAQPADSVILAPGTYREVVALTVSGQEGKPIVFQSETKHQTIISEADGLVTVPHSNSSTKANQP